MEKLVLEGAWKVLEFVHEKGVGTLYVTPECHCLKVQCVRFRTIGGIEYYHFILLVYNLIIFSKESIMLHRHVSRVAQNGQTKH